MKKSKKILTALILSAIIKDLKPNNDTIPPVLNKGVLADTITDLETRLKNNPKENFDFNKMYQNNLRTSFMKDSSTGETMTGWVVIPSKENDTENFEKKSKLFIHKFYWDADNEFEFKQMELEIEELRKQYK